MAIGKVEICGVDTSSLPVITNERMRQLFPLVHSGDMQAREEFLRGNLRLVLSVLQRFHHRGENVDDLFQVGCIGLIKALDHFDVSQNVRFSTYAVPMIIGEIRRYLRVTTPSASAARFAISPISLSPPATDFKPSWGVNPPSQKLLSGWNCLRKTSRLLLKPFRIRSACANPSAGTVPTR